MAAGSASTLDIRYEYPDSSPSHARRALRNAYMRLSERGLASSSKWALELLVCVPRPAELDEIKSPRLSGLNFHVPSSTPSHKVHSQTSVYPTQSTPALNWDQSQTSDHSGRFHNLRPPPSPLNDGSSLANRTDKSGDATSSASAHVHFAPSADVSVLTSEDGARYMHGGGMQYEESWEEDEEDSFMLAKSLFDHHQWERCATLLEARKVSGSKALFLKLYARYLVLERRSEEDYFQVSRKSKQINLARKEFLPLLRELIDPSDPFLLFLKGVLFRKLGKRIEAMDCFIRSLDTFPYNWGAWQELSSTLEGGQAELQEISSLFPDSFMTSFFCEHFGRASAARMTDNDALDRIETLLHIFPNAPYLLVCKGQTLHLLQDLEASEEAYEAARAVDPYRLEGMADYSNNLFLQRKEEKLAHLTHSLSEAGREDAEVCCAVGNYHTLRGDNHRAVEVFKRAVRLDPSMASAWILLGHAYIELKDSIAASEMYRKALELNPRDVRAWTGLGNTYELNSSWAYALHYHKKAAANSPYDGRFWASMANCYEKLRQNASAIECYKKVLTLDDSEDPESQIAVMENIARLYEDGGLAQLENACRWHCRIVQLIERLRSQGGMGAEVVQIKDHVQSYIIAARWEMGDYAVEGEEGEEMQTDESSNSSFFRKTARNGGAPQPGNLTLANDYLQKVIMTGTEAALDADELLKRLAFLRT